VCLVETSMNFMFRILRLEKEIVIENKLNKSRIILKLIVKNKSGLLAESLFFPFHRLTISCNRLIIYIFLLTPIFHPSLPR